MATDPLFMDDDAGQPSVDDTDSTTSSSLSRAAFLSGIGAVSLGLAVPSALAAQGARSVVSAADRAARVRNASVNGLGLSLVTTMAQAPPMVAWMKRDKIKVSVTPVSDDSETIAKLVAGGAQNYNLVTWISQWRNGYLAADVFQPLDLKRIPNTKNIIKGFGGSDIVASARGKGRKPFAVPIYWNGLGIAYDSARIEAPKSYVELLAPEYKGKIIMFDAAGAVMSLGCQALGFKMNTLTKVQLELVKDLLVRFVRQTRTIAKSPADLANIMAAGDALVGVPASMVVPARAAEAGRNSIRIQTKPTEGLVSWTEFLSIPKGVSGTSLDVAYEYINNVLTLPVTKYWGPLYGALPSVEGGQQSVPSWFKASIDVKNLDKLWKRAPASFFPPANPTVPGRVSFQEFLNAWQQAKSEAG